MTRHDEIQGMEFAMEARRAVRKNQPRRTIKPELEPADSLGALAPHLNLTRRFLTRRSLRQLAHFLIVLFDDGGGTHAGTLFIGERPRHHSIFEKNHSRRWTDLDFSWPTDYTNRKRKRRYPTGDARRKRHDLMTPGMELQIQPPDDGHI